MQVLLDCCFKACGTRPNFTPRKVKAQYYTVYCTVLPSTELSLCAKQHSEELTHIREYHREFDTEFNIKKKYFVLQGQSCDILCFVLAAINIFLFHPSLYAIQ
jgi:hypothetical protein